MMRDWIDLTTLEFQSIDPARAVALLPVAAIEQHGPHLAVSVDSDINTGIIAAAAEFVDEEVPVYVLPQLAVGKSNEHQHFPGTLTLKPETLTALWTDVAESVIRTGFRKLIVFNSHGGQPQIVDIVIRDLRVRHGVFAVAVNLNGLGLPDGLFDAEELSYGIHGGAVETSIMLQLQPNRVRQDEISDFVSAAAAIEREHEFLRFEGPIAIGWMTQDLNPSGAVGDARKACAEHGLACVRHAAQNLATLLAEVSKYHTNETGELRS